MIRDLLLRRTGTTPPQTPSAEPRGGGIPPPPRPVVEIITQARAEGPENKVSPEDFDMARKKVEAEVATMKDKTYLLSLRAASNKWRTLLTELHRQ